MDSKQFVNMCIGNYKKKKKNGGIAVPMDASDWNMDSTPGSRLKGDSKSSGDMGGGSVESTAPVVVGGGAGGSGDGAPTGDSAAPAGDGGGAAGGMGESNEDNPLALMDAIAQNNKFAAHLEGLAHKYPNSDVVTQIQKMFAESRKGNFDPIYCSADGTSTKSK